MSASRRSKLTPGRLVLTRFRAAGISARALAGLVDRHHTSLVRMAQRGQVPHELQRALLDVAPKHGVQLTADELINGAAA